MKDNRMAIKSDVKELIGGVIWKTKKPMNGCSKRGSPPKK